MPTPGPCTRHARYRRAVAKSIDKSQTSILPVLDGGPGSLSKGASQSAKSLQSRILRQAQDANFWTLQQP